MTGPEILAQYNRLADEKGYARVNRFKDLKTAAARLEKMKAAPPANTEEKDNSGWRSSKFRIVCEGNPRRKGTKAHGLWDSMAKYWFAHKDATAAHVLRDTQYRAVDFRWDLGHGNIELIE